MLHINPTDNLWSNAHYPPHKHDGITTHLILNGQFTMIYRKIQAVKNRPLDREIESTWMLKEFMRYGSAMKGVPMQLENEESIRLVLML